MRRHCDGFVARIPLYQPSETSGSFGDREPMRGGLPVEILPQVDALRRNLETIVRTEVRQIHSVYICFGNDALLRSVRLREHVTQPCNGR